MVKVATVSVGVRSLWAQALSRERTLILFALFMALVMLPTLLAMGLDERQVRGVNVWVKPLKFMASLSVFAASTAWFVGLLVPPQRRAWPMRFVVWVMLVAGTAEVGYICWQAALGQASHYNRVDVLHQVLYGLMGVGATLLMLTQLVLAQQILRHGDPAVPRFWRWSVALGLVMTFVLGTTAAFALAQARPPAGMGLPLVGWHLGGADLRVAHFVGSHAQQFVPLAAWLLMRLAGQQASAGLLVFCLAYTALWARAFQLGLTGAVWLPLA